MFIVKFSTQTTTSTEFQISIYLSHIYLFARITGSPTYRYPLRSNDHFHENSPGLKTRDI